MLQEWLYSVVQLLLITPSIISRTFARYRKLGSYSQRLNMVGRGYRQQEMTTICDFNFFATATPLPEIVFNKFKVWMLVKGLQAVGYMKFISCPRDLLPVQNWRLNIARFVNILQDNTESGFLNSGRQFCCLTSSDFLLSRFQMEEKEWGGGKEKSALCFLIRTPFHASFLIVWEAFPWILEQILLLWRMDLL